jgi:transcriptional regulator with XRE-family HTH domain
MITPQQSRMARAALKWGIRDLAREAGVAISTINRFETEQAEPIRATLVVLRQTFQSAGIEFFDDGGVRLKREVEGSG